MSSNLKISTYEWPGRTLFGFGAVTHLKSQAESLGCNHLFILCDPGISNLLEPVTHALTKAGMAFTLYNKVISNPDVLHTDAAGAAFKQSGADCVVGIGGGSALDMAKGVRLLAGITADASSAEFMSTLGDKVRPAPKTHQMPPMVAIPTTAGTGSEVTPWGVITDHQRKQKAGIGGVNLLPTVALIDPDLTLSLPPFLTAATGMDALSHLIEAYVSTQQNPVLDSLILRGIKLVGHSLRTAVHHPDNQQARSDMLEASMLGGIALSSNWLGACHSLAHQLSTFADMHHGLACAMMLPPQMRFSLSGAPGLYADIAQQLAPSGESVTASDAPELVHQLNVDVNLPTQLRHTGVTRDLIPVLSEFAFKDSNWTTNPRETTQQDLEAMYRQAF